MRARVVHVVVVVLGLAIVSAACGTRQTSTAIQQDPIAVGDEAPGFSLPSANTGPVSLSDFAGKPVLLYFSMGPG